MLVIVTKNKFTYGEEYVFGFWISFIWQGSVLSAKTNFTYGGESLFELFFLCPTSCYVVVTETKQNSLMEKTIYLNWVSTNTNATLLLFYLYWVCLHSCRKVLFSQKNSTAMWFEYPGPLPVLNTECLQRVSESFFTFYINYPSQK